MRIYSHMESRYTTHATRRQAAEPELCHTAHHAPHHRKFNSQEVIYTPAHNVFYKRGSGGWRRQRGIVLSNVCKQACVCCGMVWFSVPTDDRGEGKIE